jgi:hypothetical protein
MRKMMSKNVEMPSDELMIRDLQEAVDSGSAFYAASARGFANMRQTMPSRGDYFERKSFVTFELNGVEVLSVSMCELPVTIGRGERVDCRLDYDGISRVHCRLERVGGLVRLCDAGSKNGILVNEKKIQVQDLCDGDVVQLGTACLRVRRM